MMTVTRRPPAPKPYTISNCNDVDYEQVILCIGGEDNLRSCRHLQTPENDEPVPGEATVLVTTGSGDYCQWYHYLSLNGNFYLIFRTYSMDNGEMMWKYYWRQSDAVPRPFGFAHDDDILFPAPPGLYPPAPPVTDTPVSEAAPPVSEAAPPVSDVPVLFRMPSMIEDTSETKEDGDNATN